MSEVSSDQWQWFGHAGHFICGRWCRFHLCTKVGNYLVSTVGEYWPERPVREIHAKVHDPAWFAKNASLKGDHFDAAYSQRFGFMEIGCDRLYETMVFLAGEPCSIAACNCGLPDLGSDELDFAPANTAGEATANHMRLCREWAAKSTPTPVENSLPPT